MTKISTTRMMTIDHGYYCSQKFWWLTVDLEKFRTSSCCSAMPDKIDLAWLSQNPGQLFNSPTLIEERQLMLANQPVSSCNASCWQAEAKGQVSRRLSHKSQIRTHLNPISTPEVLNIIVGSDCNMTCVYCGKNYSTAWMRDLRTQPYHNIVSLDDRFKITSRDRVLEQLSQKDIAGSEVQAQLIDEINQMCQNSQLKFIDITGGEPLLYVGLQNLISSIPTHIKVRITTGMGVDTKRFNRLADYLATRGNVEFEISVENIESRYEFVRYGNTWQRFLENLNTLKTHQIDYVFHITVSNITLHGLPEFLQFAEDQSVNYQICSDPDFLAPNVLDPESKQRIAEWTQDESDPLKSMIYKSIQHEASEEQYNNLRSYIVQFAQRRNLDIRILSDSFVRWLQL